MDVLSQANSMLKSDFTMAYARWTEVNRTTNLRVEIKVCVLLTECRFRFVEISCIVLQNYYTTGVKI